ncbi:MAG: serine protease, partial [Planctomycetota bacterium]
LLTTYPMGGQVGTEFEVTISGEHLNEVSELRFSDSRITAAPVKDKEGNLVASRFLVSVDSQCPVGLYEASVMTRLGLSAPRIFSIGALQESVQAKPAASVADATKIEIESICNATVAARAVNHHRFEAKRDQRIIIDGAARGIDSKLKPVVIIADENGRDLMAERGGGLIDFQVPVDGSYLVKVHDLTFQGGPYFFYRLAIRELPSDAPLPARMASTRGVNAASWPPHHAPRSASLAETEPNDQQHQAQRIELPCDLSGSFAPAADVDRFEFMATKGDVWWIEVASDRLGRPTDPTLVVQHVGTKDGNETLSDVVQLTDIPSPVKVSGNNYAYDGPPYNVGTSDLMGKIEIQDDGLHRIQLTDAFGGTRNDPRNIYRLIIREAAPDFALVAWGMHMELRNGDRNALSKPIALRGGATMPLEVVAIRRDGFNGDIELAMEDLPDGVSATGLKIPGGQSRGVMLITADEGAPRGVSSARFFGTAQIDGQTERRPCHLASMAWPVTNHWSEIPSPRLLHEVAVSVGGTELAPITIAPKNDDTLTVAQGQKLTIPLLHMRRSEFSGSTMSVRTMGTGFERAPKIDIPLGEDTSEVTLDLAALKTPPGQYQIAFYGGAVAKYREAKSDKTKDIVDIVVSKPIAIEVTAAKTP